MVPNKWVCALGGAAGRSVALRERRVCAGSPPPNSAFNRDRCYRGFLPPLPQAGQCLIYGYKGSSASFHKPQPRPRGLVGNLLKWLGAISRFLNNYKILIAVGSSLETKCFAFETCTQALSDMCITTILFKWQQAVCGKLFNMVFASITNNKHNLNFIRVLVYGYSWRRAREDNARRQAWSQLFLGDSKYVVLALLRVDGY